MRITLIDYGAGNLPSVERALRQLGADTERATVPEQIAGARALVLPGVGHFAAMMRTLELQQLLEPLRDALARNALFFGICLGLQSLYDASEEAPGMAGLGILPGTVATLPRIARLPHMGWNQVQCAGEGRLLRHVPEDAWFYFAHSYAVPAAGTAPTPRVVEMRPSPRPPVAAGSTVATCQHGAVFVAVAEKGPVMGVQFHPEKSGEAGLQVLRNFLEMTR
jgi:imidazole glycerol phosphate synthase glutamine amidotransferase subunit